MKKFQNMADLLAHLLSVDYPDELNTTAIHAMHRIDACNKGGGAPSYLLIADTKEEAEEIELEFALSNCVPESDECITTIGDKLYRQRVFVFGDAGNGVIYLEAVPKNGEKLPKTQRFPSRH